MVAAQAVPKDRLAASCRRPNAQTDEIPQLAQLRSGDERALARLYDCYWQDVNRLVWRLLPGDSEHDDLVSEVFVKVITGIRRVRDAENLRGWVLTVAVNTVRNELRRRSLWHRRRVYADTERFSAARVDPEVRRLTARTTAALERLPASERIAFTLRRLDGCTFEQVAALCECSLATAKRRVARAERRFVAVARRDPELLQLLREGGWKV